MASADDEIQEALIGTLSDPAIYPHCVQRVAHIETHIPHVLLTGRFAQALAARAAAGSIMRASQS